jgi:hypothetical protein
MRRETKFNYGLLFFGAAMPPLIDALFGPRWGLAALVLVACLGLGFLVSAHLHRERGRTETNLKRRARFVAYGLLVALAIIGVPWAIKKGRPPTPPPFNPVPLTALYIGCAFDHIPINIRSGTSIHVMWLDPSILRENLNGFPFVGPFDDIFAPAGQKVLKWPTSKDGRWMNSREEDEVMRAIPKEAPTPAAFRCTLNNYAITLDEITAKFIVDTSDGKRHTYDVRFNPSVLGQPFEFYVINKCSTGTVPVAAQWGDTATVRILGEANRRTIPLQFERKPFPSNLIPLGASLFIWNDRRSGCKWDN